jgi:hypothetical protein
MFYPDGAGWRQHYRNNIEAKGAVFYIMGCKKILGRSGQFVFFSRGDDLFSGSETFICSGFYFDKNNGTIGSDHDKVDFAGLTGEVAGKFAQAFSF